MAACHTQPFILPGVVIERSDVAGTAETPTCDYCGAATLEWRKCKLICTSCKQINKSCADL